MIKSWLLIYKYTIYIEKKTSDNEFYNFMNG